MLIRLFTLCIVIAAFLLVIDASPVHHHFGKRTGGSTKPPASGGAHGGGAGGSGGGPGGGKGTGKNTSPGGGGKQKPIECARINLILKPGGQHTRREQ